MPDQRLHPAPTGLETNQIFNFFTNDQTTLISKTRMSHYLKQISIKNPVNPNTSRLLKV